MSVNKPNTETPWIDPDDAPELDEHFFATARISRGDVVLREATDTFAQIGRAHV